MRQGWSQKGPTCQEEQEEGQQEEGRGRRWNSQRARQMIRAKGGLEEDQ